MKDRKTFREATKEATEVIEIQSVEEIDTMYKGIVAILAKKMVAVRGWYGFTSGSNKVLIWMDN